MIQLLQNNEQFQEAASKPGLVVIDVYNESSCKHLNKTYAVLPKRYSNISFYRIDEKHFTNYSQFERAANITSVPTIFVFFNGKNLVKSAISSPLLVDMLVEHCFEEFSRIFSTPMPNCSLTASPASVSLNRI